MRSLFASVAAISALAMAGCRSTSGSTKPAPTVDLEPEAMLLVIGRAPSIGSLFEAPEDDAGTIEEFLSDNDDGDDGDDLDEDDGGGDEPDIDYSLLEEDREELGRLARRFAREDIPDELRARIEFARLWAAWRTGHDSAGEVAADEMLPEESLPGHDVREERDGWRPEESLEGR